jgi:hypothetical protein
MEFSETIIHFLFGGLLSSFALFYFKSSAGLTSALFVGFVFVLLVGNEVPTFRKVGRVVRFGLLSFCVTSYFAYVFPVVFGFLSVFLFLLATVLGTATMYGLSRIVERVRGPGSGRNVRATLLPAVLVQAALLGMYVLHVVPPVPLSVTYMGVCHGVERVGGDFVLQRARSPWRLWEMVRPVFRGREGDSVHVFVAVFAPRGFQDQVNVRWAREDVGGNWRTTDVVRLAIHGGRLGGFRGHTNKARYEAGEWRVQVETADGRGIGVLRFTIVEDLDTADRDFKTERR